MACRRQPKYSNGFLSRNYIYFKILLDFTDTQIQIYNQDLHQFPKYLSKGWGLGWRMWGVGGKSFSYNAPRHLEQ